MHSLAFMRRRKVAVLCGDDKWPWCSDSEQGCRLHGSRPLPTGPEGCWLGPGIPQGLAALRPFICHLLPSQRGWVPSSPSVLLQSREMDSQGGSQGVSQVQMLPKPTRKTKPNLPPLHIDRRATQRSKDACRHTVRGC
jgi:hypothetical protein